jgi:hypothetical protein
MSAFSLLMFPVNLTINLRKDTERSATLVHSLECKSRRFGELLEPRYIFGAIKLDQ